MIPSAANCDHTTPNPGPRYRIAWPSMTKCVVGAASIIVYTNSGMLSRGVEPPESICIGTITRMNNSPNCGIERASGCCHVAKQHATNLLAH